MQFNPLPGQRDLFLPEGSLGPRKRRCYRCGKEMSMEEFQMDCNGRQDGEGRIRSLECRHCKSMRDWHRYQTPQARAKMLVAKARQRAQKEGVEFDLGYEPIRDILDDGRCQATGLRFDLRTTRDGALDPMAPSVDRIIAGGPYTMENCRVILWALNCFLNRWGIDAVLPVVAAISRGIENKSILDYERIKTGLV